jgi:hypothetical protein
MPNGKRGGRVQVNMMQYYELVDRVTVLEAIVSKLDLAKPEAVELTKNDIMKALDDKRIKYNPRDRKDILQELLNNEVTKCLDDQTE